VRDVAREDFDVDVPAWDLEAVRHVRARHVEIDARADGNVERRRREAILPRDDDRSECMRPDAGQARMRQDVGRRHGDHRHERDPAGIREHEADADREDDRERAEREREPAHLVPRRRRVRCVVRNFGHRYVLERTRAKTDA